MTAAIITVREIHFTQIVLLMGVFHLQARVNLLLLLLLFLPFLLHIALLHCTTATAVYRVNSDELKTDGWN